MSLHKTPPTPPVRTAVSVLTPENDNLKTFTETAKSERINGQTTTFPSVNESKIPTPTKISPPKDLKLTSKAAPLSNAVTTFDDYSPTSSSPTKRPIGKLSPGVHWCLFSFRRTSFNYLLLFEVYLCLSLTYRNLFRHRNRS